MKWRSISSGCPILHVQSLLPDWFTSVRSITDLLADLSRPTFDTCPNARGSIVAETTPAVAWMNQRPVPLPTSKLSLFLSSWVFSSPSLFLCLCLFVERGFWSISIVTGRESLPHPTSCFDVAFYTRKDVFFSFRPWECEGYSISSACRWRDKVLYGMSLNIS